MCGRYTLYAAPEAIAQAFGWPDFPAYKPRYNLAPGDYAPVMTRSGARMLMRWGLVPHWQAAEHPMYINARGEAASAKPAFRDAWRERRIVVITNGFYEWQTVGRLKQPYCIRYADSRPFGFAGIWSPRGPVEGEDRRFAVVTQSATGPLLAFHDRMPVILPDPVTQAAWLEKGEWPLADATWGSEWLCYRVDPRMNNPRIDDPNCVQPLRARA